MSNSDGTQIVHTITRDEVIQEINNRLGSASSSSYIVANIAARNSLNLSVISLAYVLDARGDPTVTSGAALYIYNPTNTTWSLIAEFESQIGPSISWSVLTDKPASSVAAIDAAVTNSHTHTNKASLDRYGLTATGHPTVDGNPVLNYLSQVSW